MIDFGSRHRMVQHDTMLRLVIAVTLRRITSDIEGKEDIVYNGIVKFNLFLLAFVIGIEEVIILHGNDNVLIDRINVALQYGEVIEVTVSLIILIAKEFSVDIHLTRGNQCHFTRLGINGSHIIIRRPVYERKPLRIHCHVRRIKGFSNFSRETIFLIHHAGFSLIDGILKTCYHTIVSTCTYNGDLTCSGIDAVGIVYIIVSALGQCHASQDNSHIRLMSSAVVGIGASQNRYRSIGNTGPVVEVGRNLIVILRVSDGKRIGSHAAGIRSWVRSRYHNSVVDAGSTSARLRVLTVDGLHHRQVCHRQIVACTGCHGNSTIVIDHLPRVGCTSRSTVNLFDNGGGIIGHDSCREQDNGCKG